MKTATVHGGPVPLCAGAVLAALADSAAAAPNHAARLAGLALCMPWEDTATRSLTVDGAGVTCTRTTGTEGANFNLAFSATLCSASGAALADAAAGALGLAQRWMPKWSSSAEGDAARIVVAACPNHLVPAATRGIEACGRAVTFREPCQTWEADVASWARVLSTAGLDAGALLSPALLREQGQAISTALGVPQGLVLDACTVEDAATMNEHWKYAYPGSEAVFREAVASRPSAGLRKTAAGGDGSGAGELVSWIMTRDDGSLGALHTISEYRGRGYARAVVKFAMLQLWAWRAAQAAGARECADAWRARAAARLRPYCHIKVGNEQSESLFRSLGFTPIDSVTWLVSNALAPRFALRPLNPHSETEWADLLALVLASYKQDDDFFMRPPRTDMANLRGMASTGVFYVGYEQPVAGPAAWQAEGYVPGVSAAAYPHTFASTTAIPAAYFERRRRDRLAPGAAADPAAVVAPSSYDTEGEELLVCCYLSAAPAEGAATPAIGPAQFSPASSAGSDATASLAPVASPAASAAAAESGTAFGGVSDGGADPAALPSASHHDGRPGACYQLGMMTVATRLKKLGCGQRVLDFALATSRTTHGADELEAHVVSVKPWLLDFYVRRNGFAVVGKEAWPAEAEGQLLQPVFFHLVRRSLGLHGSAYM
jgi:GNAT superfamily N-acetyltransferase